MRLNETKRKQRTSQEEVLAELFAEAELQGSVRKKKNWDAWLDQEEEQQSEKELQVYLAGVIRPGKTSRQRREYPWRSPDSGRICRACELFK